MGSKSSQAPAPTTSTTQVQVADPWSGQQPYLRELFSHAKTQLQGPGQQYYPGQQVAPMSSDTTAAQSYARNLAQSTLPQANDATMQSALFNLQGGRDVANNPYLQSAIKAAQQPTLQAFSSVGGPLSQIRQHFTGGNSGGSGTRESIAEGLALRGLGQTLDNTAAGMTMQAYTQAQDNAVRTLGLMPQTMQAATMPAQLLSGVGSSQDAYAQSLIDAEMQKWNFQQAAPMTQLQQYQQLISGNFGGSTSSSGTSVGPTPQQAKPNMWMGGLGGAASGAAIGSVIPGIGTAVGAGLGALIGILGSR